MKSFFEKIFKDKRILVIYLIVIILIVAGFTYALQISTLSLIGETAVIGVDEDAYGDTSIDTNDIDLRPILDGEVETNTDNVIKIDFVVGGNSTNTTDEVIYDIALVDLNLNCELVSEYVKWKLVKNDGEETFTGSLDYKFDTIVDGRLVLTTIQQDLAPYSSSKSGYDSYSFYLWISDSCQGDLKDCYESGNYVKQDYLLNKYISGKIEVELYTGSKKALVRNPSSELDSSTCSNGININDYMVHLYNNGSNNVVHIGGDESKPEVSLNEDNSIMLDNNGEYRYYGKSPNNYVEFNGELWRIISSSKVFSSESDTVGEQRVKIIRDESIGDYAWNSDGINDWTNSTLMCQLNTMYYNDSIDACSGKTLTSLNYSLNSTAKSLIDDALWYLNGNTIETVDIDDYYVFERRDVGFGDLPTRWTGKVGIMYPSDYAYAADLSKCKTLTLGSNLQLCAQTVWLNNGYSQWLISPYYSSYNDSAFLTFGDGSVNYDGMEYGLSVRPTVYLKSDIMVIDGDGSRDDPYKLWNGKYLNEVEVGSYVKYVGYNGCSDGHCDGTNANYVDDSNMGYCNNPSTKFIENGWRVGYINNGSVHLISGGAPECFCTNSEGITSNNINSDSCGTFETTKGAPKHIANLNKAALKYCNPSYVKSGVCDSTTAWGMNAEDFQKITGKVLSLSSCYLSSTSSCGIDNSIIDNGSYYWIATAYDSTSSELVFSWVPVSRYVSSHHTNIIAGLRPVISLASSVKVVGGTGTMTDPYVISK